MVLVKTLVWHWCHSKSCNCGAGENIGLALVSLALKILLEASGLSPAGARTMSRCATWDLHHNLFLL